MSLADPVSRVLTLSDPLPPRHKRENRAREGQRKPGPTFPYRSIRCRSHALANRQSPLTVRSETLRTTATSFTDIPAK